MSSELHLVELSTEPAGTDNDLAVALAEVRRLRAGIEQALIEAWTPPRASITVRVMLAELLEAVDLT